MQPEFDPQPAGRDVGKNVPLPSPKPWTITLKDHTEACELAYRRGYSSGWYDKEYGLGWNPTKTDKERIAQKEAKDGKKST